MIQKSTGLNLIKFFSIALLAQFILDTFTFNDILWEHFDPFP